MGDRLDGIQRQSQADRNKCLNKGQRRLVERLIAHMGMRLAEAGLRHVHAGASGHAMAFDTSRHLIAGAGVERYRELHEQQGGERDEAGGEAGWAGKFHFFLKSLEHMQSCRQ